MGFWSWVSGKKGYWILIVTFGLLSHLSNSITYRGSIYSPELIAGSLFGSFLFMSLFYWIYYLIKGRNPEK